MSVDIQRLHIAIAAVCPILGVRVENPSDKNTWVIHFQESATQQQQTDAQAVITAWDDGKFWTWDGVRAERDARLQACDWTQFNDSPLSSEAKSSWAAYRRDLRNVPQDYTNPQDVVWPTKPA